MSSSWHPVASALLGTLFTYGMTAAGAAVVFFTAKVNQRVMDGFFGFAAGVMIAASCFGLLIPAVDAAKEQEWSKDISWLPAAIGFLLGVGFLKAVEHFLLDHHHPVQLHELEEIPQGRLSNGELRPEGERGENDTEALDPSEIAQQGKKSIRKRISDRLFRLCCGADIDKASSTWNRMFLLVFAITLHNFPEGLAVGVGFGAVAHARDPDAAFGSAVALAIGIGIQNFPEGLGVAMPLRREGMSRVRSFVHGQFSGVVEPIGGVLGAYAVLVVAPILPFSLAFAAGAMMFVVVEELIPESQRSGNKNIATVGTMLGFTLMMCLDIALG